jgi:carboxypeptidase Taq
MTPEQAYEKLEAHSKETAHLGSAIGLLHWDQSTYIPAKGHAHRADQLAALAGILHRMITDPNVGEWLAAAEGTDFTSDPISPQAVNVREWRRSYDRAVKIPERLASELARAAAEGRSAWEKARPENDWDTFRPYLERLVALKREQAEVLGYENEPYDALLDYYEQGETARNLGPLFARLRAPLVDLLERIKASAIGAEASLGGLVFPVADQKAFATDVARKIGYDLKGGRLDESAHPFTLGVGPGDVRITSRYSEHLFGEGFFAVIHESGHAIYHQGLPAEHWGTPISRPISLGINESQSRLWENMVARSLPFWRYLYPRAREKFPSLRDLSLATFYRAVNDVRPSLIRVEADEVTYNLHILLRFELEIRLIRGDLEVRSLPEAWNEKMHTYLGLTPPDYASGVMQDVHWSSGSIGYFPTYTLGNLYAAQFMDKVTQDLGDLGALMESGYFGPLLQWLRQKIHSQGSRYRPKELIRHVTGEDLNPKYLLHYLEGKYAPMYGL